MGCLTEKIRYGKLFAQGVPSRPVTGVDVTNVEVRQKVVLDPVFQSQLYQGEPETRWIGFGVGYGERNIPADVFFVQHLLNFLITHGGLVPLALIAETGQIDGATTFAIRYFQRSHLHHPNPDGRVTPNSQTLQKMVEVVGLIRHRLEATKSGAD
ncbi:MAG TPA: hypothetical protein PLB18_03920 [Acidobacteriota bacterium]|nr:hypothetical protein [Acidobacteriota bacterium]HNG92322.1 hypothetical protein [Acidobacteriota bacterium]